MEPKYFTTTKDYFCYLHAQISLSVFTKCDLSIRRILLPVQLLPLVMGVPPADSVAVLPETYVLLWQLAERGVLWYVT